MVNVMSYRNLEGRCQLVQPQPPAGRQPEPRRVHLRPTGRDPTAHRGGERRLQRLIEDDALRRAESQIPRFELLLRGAKDLPPGDGGVAARELLVPARVRGLIPPPRCAVD